MAVALTFRGSDAGARATAEALAKSLDQLGISADKVKFQFDDTEKHGGALFGRLKDIRGEARQHERVFNFYGAKLAEVTGIAKGLGTEITGLGIALGSGMWAIAAIEALRLIIGHFKDALGAANDLNAADLENINRAVKTLQTSTASLHDEWLKLKGFDPEMVKAADQIKILNSQIDALTAKMSVDPFGKISGTPEQEEQLDRLTAKVRELVAAMQGKREEGGAVANIKATTDAQKAATAAQLAQDRDYYASLREYQKLREKELDDFNRKQLEEGARLAQQQKHDDEAEAAHYEDVQHRNAKAYEDSERRKAHATEVFADIATRDLMAVAQGQKTLGEVMKETALQAAQYVINLVLKKIAAYAVEAAAGAFAAESSIPIVGPAIGAASAAEVLREVQALAANVPALATGGPVSGGNPYLVGERGPELFVPNSSGSIVPNDKLGGVTVNIHTMDAQSFLGAMRSRKSEMVRVFRELAAEGRL